MSFSGILNSKNREREIFLSSSFFLSKLFIPFPLILIELISSGLFVFIFEIKLYFIFWPELLLLLSLALSNNKISLTKVFSDCMLIFAF